MTESPLRQLFQVPLPASLSVYGDFRHCVAAPRDDDFPLVRVGDRAGKPVRDKVIQIIYLIFECLTLYNIRV